MPICHAHIYKKIYKSGHEIKILLFHTAKIIIYLLHSIFLSSCKFKYPSNTQFRPTTQNYTI